MRERRAWTAGPLSAASIALASAGALGAAPVDNNRAGAALFETRCMACHSLDANRVGPMLGGVVGRKVASVSEYDYSEALRRRNGRWNARRLDAWLRDPQAVAPGTKMGFALQDAQERRQVIWYLGSTGARPGPKPR